MFDPDFEFNRYPPHFSEGMDYCDKTALFLAVMSHLAYQKSETVEQTIKHFSGQPTFICQSTAIDIDTQCFVAEFANHVLVAFRGSWQWQDWLTSIQFPETDGPLSENNEGKVHKGMWDALKPVVEQILQILGDLDLDNKQLWLTGHSLGGGLVNIFAGVLKTRGIEITGIYTFACPRITDDHHASQIEQSILGPYFRIENRFDPVPDLPPKRLVSYRHSGKLIDIEENTGYFYRNWRRFWKTLFQIETGFRKMLKIPNPYHRHNLATGRNSYIPRLERRVGL